MTVGIALSGVAALTFLVSCTPVATRKIASQRIYSSSLEAAKLKPESLPSTEVKTYVVQSSSDDVKWLLYDGKHWQRTVSGLKIETPEEVDRALGVKGSPCKYAGMVEVRGEFKVDRALSELKYKTAARTVEDLQKTTCTNWIAREYPERCRSFDPEKWENIAQTLKTKPLHFCMDRYEYPNQKGAYPIIMVNWDEAHRLCEKQSKRLCNEEEWTFACEGEESLPYPTGYERLVKGDGSPEAPRICNIDHQWKVFNEKALSIYRNSHTELANQTTANELERLWQGRTSGTMEKCVSPFGVYDMTGNVDEWTQSAHFSKPASEYREGEISVKGNLISILKGGYWGPVRTRCRPATRSHDHNHIFYQQSFRCCADI